jgi:GTPase
MPNAHPERSTLPAIAIVGRANVGKSSLWNRIIEEKRAIISAKPHTTRDRNIAEAVWRGLKFEVVDTGGIDTESDEIGEGIRRQAERAIAVADAIFFLVDAKTGVLPEDRAIAKILRSAGQRVIVLVNKVDGPRDLAAAAESGAEALGFGTPMNISAVTGSGVGDALDKAFEVLGGEEAKSLELRAKDRKDDSKSRLPKASPGTGSAIPQPLRIVLIGRPNVGKSSLVNAMLGEERVIVSSIAHTTREPQDTALTLDGREIVLVDTAGMRRRSNIKGEIEEESIERNRLALQRADVGVLILDATEPVSGQDKLLAGLIAESGRGLVVVVNKWDLIEGKTTKSAKEAETNVREELPFVNWAPIVFASAKTGRRAQDVLLAAVSAQDERKREIAYNAINRLLKSAIRERRPLQRLGPKSPYIYDIAQTGTEPPTFLITVRGQRIILAPAWMKFLERRIREQFGFGGSPIVVKASIVPMAKSDKERNVRGPGMAGASEAASSKTATGKKKAWAKRKVLSSHHAPRTRR